MKDFFKKGENIFSLLLLIAFFLPWVDLGIISVPGYKITQVFEGIAGLGRAFGEKDIAVPSYIYTIYLIPVVSLLILYMSYKGKTPKLLSGFLGSIILIIILFISLGNSSFINSWGIGMYLTVLSAIGLILSALNIIKIDKSPTN